MSNLLLAILRLPFVIIGAVFKTIFGALAYLLGFAVIAKDSFAAGLMSASTSCSPLQSVVSSLQSHGARFANRL